MKLIYLYTLAIFAMFLFYGIARLFFDSRKSYRQSRNYIFAKALTAIVIFFTIRYGIGDQLLQLAVNTLHDMGWTSLAVPSPNQGWTNIVADGFFLLAVVSIVGLYTWSDLRQVMLKDGMGSNYEKEGVKIQFPKEPQPINPIFHERIKELFELKFQTQNLQLEYDSKRNILFGKYKDGFRHYVKMIHCDESVHGRKVDAATLKLIYRQMNKEFQKMEDNGTTFLDTYYVLDRGSFASIPESIQTLTEDDLLNELIDFEPYLKKLIYPEFDNVIIIGCFIGLILGCFSSMALLGGVNIGANLGLIICFFTIAIQMFLGMILRHSLGKVIGLKLIMLLSPLALSYLIILFLVGKFRNTIFFSFFTKKLNFLSKAWHIALLKGQFKKEDYPEMVYYLENHFNKKL